VPVDDDTIMFHDGKLKVGTIGTSQVQGLTTALGLKADAAALSAGLAGKANVTHTHTAADITDFSMGTPVLIAGSADDTATASGGMLRAADRTGTDVTGADLSIAAGNGTGAGGSGNIQLLTAASGEAGSAAGTMTPRVTIDKSGNVGIGTTAPEALLNIYGGSARIVSSNTSTNLTIINSESSSTVYPYITVDNYKGDIGGHSAIVMSNARGSLTNPSAVQLWDTLGRLIFQGHDGTTFRQSASINAYAVGPFVSSTNTPTDLAFLTASTTAARTERMRITSSGNVGIGTTSPSNALSVVGSANVTGNVGIGSTAPTQPLDVAGIIRSSSGGFMFPDGSTMTSALPTPSSGYSSTTDLNMAADFGGNGTGNMVLSTRGTERLRITNAGNIGIGSMTPGAKMEVVSGGAASGLRVLSGSATNWTGYTLGRTSTEATLGIAASANSLATGAMAGDVVLRTETTSQRLMLGSGTGAPSATVSNGGIAIGTYAASDTPPTSGLIVSGAVGIGTNAPTQALEVAGTIKSSAGGFMFPDGSVMTTAAAAGMSGTTSTSDLNLVADSDSVGVGDVILSSKGSERMRIVNGGNVGIGTLSPRD
jgi:hypothetical protein